MNEELEVSNPGGPDLKPVIRLLLCLTLCYTVSLIGYWGGLHGLIWYVSLNRPTWAAPVNAFVPIWTVMTAFVAAAGWQAWNAPAGRLRTVGLILFGVQLGLGGLWPWLFFSGRFPIGAMVEIVLLWLTLLATTITLWRQRPTTGALLLPYLAWILFLAVLDIDLWKLNR